MKTIEEAAKDFNDSHVNGHHPQKWVSDIFKAGVEFAQRRIPVEEELPSVKNWYINKEVIAFTSDNCAYILIYDDYLGWLPNGTDADIDNITHWRLIELI